MWGLPSFLRKALFGPQLAAGLGPAPDLQKYSAANTEQRHAQTEGGIIEAPEEQGKKTERPPPLLWFKHEHGWGGGASSRSKKVTNSFLLRKKTRGNEIKFYKKNREKNVGHGVLFIPGPDIRKLMPESSHKK